MPSTGIPVPSTFTGVLRNQATEFGWYADFGTRDPQPLSARVHFLLLPKTASRECMIDNPVYECGAGANNRQGCTEKQAGGVKQQ
jgi:hypothetical protein